MLAIDFATWTTTDAITSTIGLITAWTRPHGPYGPHRSHGQSRFHSAKNQLRIQQMITAQRLGVAWTHSATSPASTSLISSTISVHVGKKVCCLLNSIARPVRRL